MNGELIVDATVGAIDAAGIERLMLCAWHRPGSWVITNDDVDRALGELGFKALRVIPWLWDRPPDDRLCYPLYARCVELGIPFCAQVGHTGPAMPSEPGRPIPYLDRVALDFPELTIVAGHIGHPWTEEMIGLAWKHDNVFGL